MNHVPALIEEAEIDPRYILLYNARGSSAKLQHLARYVSAPRVGPARGDRLLYSSRSMLRADSLRKPNVRTSSLCCARRYERTSRRKGLP